MLAGQYRAVMAGPSMLVEVILNRQDVTTNWGFALTGGSQVYRRLFVTKVHLGTPAEGRLEAGEVIVSINGYDLTKATLTDAINVVKNSGYQLVIVIDRSCMTKAALFHTPGMLPPHKKAPSYLYNAN